MTTEEKATWKINKWFSSIIEELTVEEMRILHNKLYEHCNPEEGVVESKYNDELYLKAPEL